MDRRYRRRVELQPSSDYDRTTTAAPWLTGREPRILYIFDSSARSAFDLNERNHKMLGRSERLLQVNGEGKKRHEESCHKKAPKAQNRTSQEEELVLC